MTSPISSSYTGIGDPDWWLPFLVRELLLRQPILEVRGRYVEGNHDVPRGDRRYMRALRDLQRLARTNYIGLATNVPVQRMRVRGFRFGPTSSVDPDAKKIWSANDMDLQSTRIHTLAAKYGMVYAHVAQPEDQWPVITVHDPRCAITYADPSRPTLSLAGVRMWADDLFGRIVACLDLPDATYEYVGPETHTLEGFTLHGLVDRLCGVYGSASAFDLVNVIPNPTGLCSLVEYIWKPESGIVPQGECGDDIRDAQDRINATVLDRIVISRAQAYKQRWATGVTVEKGKKGQGKPPFDLGADMLWVTEDKDTKFGEFQSADIRQILEAIRDDVADIAALTQTPAHYLMGKIANISGETLAQVESGLVSKCRQRMYSVGWGHERVMKLCFAYMGNQEKATDIEAETLWMDPGQNSIMDLASAGTQLTAAGWPLELVMERQGATPDEIDFAVEAKKQADAEAAVQAQQQAQMAHANALELAQTTGKAQNTGSPGATSKPAPQSKKPKKAPGG